MTTPAGDRVPRRSASADCTSTGHGPLAPARLALRLGRGLLAGLVAGALALGATACSKDGPDLIVYCSMNQVAADPVFRRFEAETGLRVLVEYDTEAARTVGLARRLREEAAAGVHRADAFWNNEVANTVALAQEGLLQSYRSPAAEGIDERWFGPGDLYHMFAGRGRVMIANTELMDPAELTGLEDLFDPRWRGQAAFVRPLAGTTLTHLTALHTVFGDEFAQNFARRLRDANREGQVRIFSGNMALARAVGQGEVAFGFTDTNDFMVVRSNGFPVAQVIPDQGEGGMGMALMPNTVSILKGARNVEAARRFVDFMVSRENERYLAENNAQIPFHRDLIVEGVSVDLGAVRLMEIDYEEVGRHLLRVQDELRPLFLE